MIPQTAISQTMAIRAPIRQSMSRVYHFRISNLIFSSIHISISALQVCRRYLTTRTIFDSLLLRIIRILVPFHWAHYTWFCRDIRSSICRIHSFDLRRLFIFFSETFILGSCNHIVKLVAVDGHCLIVNSVHFVHRPCFVR